MGRLRSTKMLVRNCPFCFCAVDWDIDLETEPERRAHDIVVAADCPFCGKVTYTVLGHAPKGVKDWNVLEGYYTVHYVLEDDGHLRSNSARLDESDNIVLHINRETQTPTSQVIQELSRSLEDISLEALKAITFGVLGGLAKDAIEDRFLGIQIGSDPDKRAREFEKALERVLNRFDMKFCPYCQKATGHNAAFCDRCGACLN